MEDYHLPFADFDAYFQRNWSLFNCSTRIQRKEAVSLMQYIQVHMNPVFTGKKSP